MTGFRLTDDEAWTFVSQAHTGILTTLRRDGRPIALPVWFAALDRRIWVHTRGTKLTRVRHDPRASFLVETGDHWADLMAVHLSGTVEVVPADAIRADAVDAEMHRKYERFRPDPSELPPRVASAYGSHMEWLRFTPDPRVLTWNNRALLEEAP